MTVSRTEIQRKEFHTSLRGYNMEEVDRFLDQVARELDRLTKENKELLAKIELLESKVAESEEMKSVIQAALLSAQKAAEDIRKSAQSEAENILQAAREMADTEIKDLDREKKVVQKEIEKLGDVQGQIRKRIRSFLQSLLSSLDAVDIMEGIVFPEVLEEIPVGSVAEKGSESADQQRSVSAEEPSLETEEVSEDIQDKGEVSIEASGVAEEVVAEEELADLEQVSSDSLPEVEAPFLRKGSRKKMYPKIADEEL
ncbi:cell division initiation protein, partial [Candidatus Hakubella thermalkaliphila]